jgi:hypothetical protein
MRHGSGGAAPIAVLGMRRSVARAGAFASAILWVACSEPTGPPVAAVSIQAPSELVEFDSVILAASLHDASGNAVQRRVTWSSLDPGIVTVSSSGLATARHPGVGRVVASAGTASEAISDTAFIRGVVVFRTVSAGEGHTCAVTSKGSVYCWGSNVNLQLGFLNSGYSRIPVKAPAGPSSLDVTAGWTHSCARTSTAVSCWGRNDAGAFGVGPGFAGTSGHLGMAFSALTAGDAVTCGLVGTDGYCWGQNGFGALGDGTHMDRWSPVPVAGGLALIEVSAGRHKTCAVTTSGAAYCWGLNLGVTPTPVPGGLTFTTISTGGGHTCAVTTAHELYCWGSNGVGQLGRDPQTVFATADPLVVPGGLLFSSVTTGDGHTCGITTSNSAYCWGGNASGALGIGVDTPSVSQPQRVQGTYTSVSAGASHTCAIGPGVQAASVAYCWGQGAIGDSSAARRDVPTRVWGQAQAMQSPVGVTTATRWAVRRSVEPP